MWWWVRFGYKNLFFLFDVHSVIIQISVSDIICFVLPPFLTICRNIYFTQRLILAWLDTEEVYNFESLCRVFCVPILKHTVIFFVCTKIGILPECSEGFSGNLIKYFFVCCLFYCICP